MAESEPGQLGETGWTILAANASAAAKLRQLQPHIERRWPSAAGVVATRVRGP